MSRIPRDALERVFPRQEWSSGLGRLAIFWSVINGLLLTVLLFVIGLWVALLFDQGHFSASLSASQALQFAAITGSEPKTLDPPPVDPQAAPANDNSALENRNGPGAAAPADDFVLKPGGTILHHYEDSGLLPTVWRSRDVWWGRLIAAAYRNFAAFRSNQPAVLSLLALSAVVWLLRMWTIGQLRTTCRGAALEVSARLRRQLQRQALRLGTEDLDGGGRAGALDLFINVVDRIRKGLFDWLYRGTRFPIELLVVLLTAASVEILLTAQWVLLSILTAYIVLRSQLQVEQIRRLAEDRSQQALREVSAGLNSARVVRGYGVDAAEYELFQTQLERYTEQVRLENRLQDDPLWLRTLVLIVAASLGTLLLYVLSSKVLAGEVTPASATVFLVAFLMGVRAIAELRRFWQQHREISAAIERVLRYVDQLPGVSQAVGAKFIQPLSKTVHFEHVTYTTPEKRQLLERLDLQLDAGRSYALLSIDPHEPRAFAALLPRFIEPQVGRVLFDGEDLAWGTLESIRAEVLWVSADDPPLSGTILENIRARRPEITLTQATEAAKEARAHSFISRLPQGYETVLTGRDDPLDAGQRFRLSLARALVRNPAVLILEEPEDELDEDTKNLLDDAYSRICSGRTVFFLPTRLSTVRRADDVLLFHHGRVEAYGPQAVLVKESRLYQHWEYMRFHEFRRETV